MNIFEKIKSGLAWVGKEIGRGLAALPKIIRLAQDAEEAAAEALPLTLAVITDAGELTKASAKDSGKFLVAFAALTAAITAAVAAKALNISADAAVVSAFEAFCADFNAANVQDVLTAWHQLAADTAKLDATVIAAIEKMEQDA